MARSDWGIAVIGLGGIAQAHLTAYQKFGLNVVGGAELDESRLKTTVERFNLRLTSTDFREIVAHPEVRIVDITVPHYREARFPVVEFTAQQRKPMTVQKPMMQYLDDAIELVEIAEKHDAPLMVHQNSIFVPAWSAFEPYLRDGSFMGRVYWFQIDSRFWGDVSEHPHFGKKERWTTSDWTVHQIALACHWFGHWQQLSRSPEVLGPFVDRGNGDW